MKLDANGYTMVTEIASAATKVGLYAADGSTNMYDASGDGLGGRYTAGGALRVYPVDGTAITGRYAPNGAMYVIDAPGNCEAKKNAHPCGAMQTDADWTD